MVEGEAPAKRRRLGAHGMIFRRRRIFARLREGFTYEEIAAEEGVSHSRIRQIVSEELQKRAVDSGADHAKLQLDRLAPAVQLGAEAIAAGDISAINPYLKTLDRLDRYQSVAGAHQGYDDEARKKLHGQDQPHGRKPRRRRGLCGGGARAPEGGRRKFRPTSRTKPAGGGLLRGRPNSAARRTRPRRRAEVRTGSGFFSPTGRNPLKSLDSEK